MTTKPEKMTAEQLADALFVVGLNVSHGPVRRIRAHIAALEAERDDLRVAHRAAEAELEMRKAERDAYKRDFEAELAGVKILRQRHGACDDETFIDFVARLAQASIERDAFRERMQTLEAENTEERRKRGLAEQAVTRALQSQKRAESRLAAIHERVDEWVDGRAPARVMRNDKAIARYILGPDTTEEVLHGDDAPEEAEDPIDAAPEPTTAEGGEAVPMLSLLERHMGAMADEVRRVCMSLAILPRPVGHSGDEGSGDCDEDCSLCMWEQCRAMGEALSATLTDAPAVFTLEEVESCMQDDQECWKVVRGRLAALRDATPGGSKR